MPHLQPCFFCGTDTRARVPGSALTRDDEFCPCCIKCRLLWRQAIKEQKCNSIATFPTLKAEANTRS